MAKHIATSKPTARTSRPRPAPTHAQAAPKEKPKVAPKPQPKAAPKADSATSPKRAPFSVAAPEVRRAQRQGASEGASSWPRWLPSLRAIAITAVVIVLIGVVGAISFVVLSRTSAFAIESVIVTSSEHVSEESLARLAKPEDGATLLNVDTEAIEESVMRNPWVAEVHIERSFPHTLRVSVTERRVRALVVMGSGEVVWCLGDGGVWIEPIQVSAAEDQDFAAAALEKAREMHATLITDVPESVSPEAAAEATDEAILAVTSYMSGFTALFSASISSYSAPSAASVSCTLSSGVVVSLGEADSVSAKEAVVKQLLEDHPGQITYINVRVPANPSYRTIDTTSVQEGTGTLGGSGVDPEAAQQSEERAEAGVPEEDRIQSSTNSYDDTTDDYYEDGYDDYYDEDWY